MRKIRNIIKRAFVLKAPIAYIVSVPCFALVGIVLSQGYTGLLAFVAYLLSSYALVALCVSMIRDLSLMWELFINSSLYRNICELPIIGAFIQDDALRIRLSLYFGAFVNLLYVILKISTGIIYRSYWLVFFGVYYLALAVLRLFIIEKDSKNINGKTDSIADYRRFRACGLILLFLNVVLAFITMLAVEFKAEVDYPGVLIFGMALYSFYAFIITLSGVIKYRRHERVMFTAAKASSFTAALVSMLSLEIAMTARFGTEDYMFRKWMAAITGAGVFVTVFIIAILMILRANRLIRQ